MSSKSATGDALVEDDRLARLQEGLDYRFADPDLLSLALTHRSAANESGTSHNERLEFLGDAVVGLVCASWLYQEFPDDAEGELARRKSSLVSSEALAVMARDLKIGDSLELGLGESRSGGRDKSSLLANAMEAVIGAVYLDGGFSSARSVLQARLSDLLQSHPELEVQDAKTRLQEVLQARGSTLPTYRHVDQTGPDHAKLFHVELWIDRRLVVSAEGRSKKAAEHRAALEALVELGHR